MIFIAHETYLFVGGKNLGCHLIFIALKRSEYLVYIFYKK